MKLRFLTWILLTCGALVFACSGKQPGKTKTDTSASDADGGSAADPNQDEEVASAQTRIRDWLGKDLSERLSGLSKDLGKKIGQQLASDGEVMGKTKALSKSVFSDPVVKKELQRISDKATEGFSNKLSLGWKALQAGGRDAYKKKVSDDATRVAVEVLAEHIKENLLKDERMARLLKEISPVMKMQGTIVAASLQENLSPRVTQKTLAVVLRIAAADDNAKMAVRVEKWIDRCDGHAGDEMEKLIVKISTLDSVNRAVRNLAIDVLGHPRTKQELIVMAQNLVRDGDVHKALVKVYDTAAFEKGDTAIAGAIRQTLALPAVDQELFAAMERLATAKGASALIGRHVGDATETQQVADIVEDFVMSVLEGCGDPTEDAN